MHVSRLSNTNKTDSCGDSRTETEMPVSIWDTVRNEDALIKQHYLLEAGKLSGFEHRRRQTAPART